MPDTCFRSKALRLKQLLSKLETLAVDTTVSANTWTQNRAHSNLPSTRLTIKVLTKQSLEKIDISKVENKTLGRRRLLVKSSYDSGYSIIWR